MIKLDLWSSPWKFQMADRRSGELEAPSFNMVIYHRWISANIDLQIESFDHLPVRRWYFAALVRRHQCQHALQNFRNELKLEKNEKTKETRLVMKVSSEIVNLLLLNSLV